MSFRKLAPTPNQCNVAPPLNHLQASLLRQGFGFNGLKALGRGETRDIPVNKRLLMHTIKRFVYPGKYEAVFITDRRARKVEERSKVTRTRITPRKVDEKLRLWSTHPINIRHPSPFNNKRRKEKDPTPELSFKNTTPEK
ncbi:hypothetical protein CIHG_04269 [Coccidioides immitis H538.4]|uniref:Uncharacterized protein n=3 Tax=Coccidioides immitis TaxID=5501 RepID=A0A0J8R8E4_COCIT|nr:hypothetical protein CIRG_09198 [Coccidioides immitis RMSCC 2394]KMU81141.1 hypothetical protein CISG_02518 [Coccidioides immitis RMSCC 3703]KMU86480.1 hypothetical protein CIHG_04269 [Coccidioides immitis H538.4]